MQDAWERAFRVCFVLFGIGVVIGLTIIITNVFFPDEVFDNPAYSGEYIGVKEVVSLIKALDTADLYYTILTGIASGVTYLKKSLP